MDINIEIRGKTFCVNDIAEVNLHWDDESKIQHATITLKNGEVTDFIEEDLPHPITGELYGFQEDFKKLAPFAG